MINRGTARYQQGCTAPCKEELAVELLNHFRAVQLIPRDFSGYLNLLFISTLNLRSFGHLASFAVEWLLRTSYTWEAGQDSRYMPIHVLKAAATAREKLLTNEISWAQGTA